MESIKSFVYLDEYKMYSISSQLFEGLTEYVLTGKKESLSESEQQKSGFASGMVMGDILIKEKDSSEKRFLHDYAFNLFEKELENRGKLYTVSTNDGIKDLEDEKFVKVKGRLMFNDYTALRNTFLEFNSLGEALGYVQYFDNSGALNDSLLEKEKEIKDRNQKNKVTIIKKELEKQFVKYLRENSMRLDDIWLKNMANILSYGYKDNFEVRLPFYDNGIIFSSTLNRDYLKESVNSLISKYSRRSEVEFTILGIITQIGNVRANLDDLETEVGNFKMASQNVINTLANLEDTFTGRLNNECIIDPIAIYREL